MFPRHWPSQVLDEMRRCLPALPDITFRDINGLPVLTACIKEALRLQVTLKRKKKHLQITLRREREKKKVKAE
jgi:hypothetical protein